jgi:hypothetical protein
MEARAPCHAAGPVEDQAALDAYVAALPAGPDELHDPRRRWQLAASYLTQIAEQVATDALEAGRGRRTSFRRECLPVAMQSRLARPYAVIAGAGPAAWGAGAGG